MVCKRLIEGLVAVGLMVSCLTFSVGCETDAQTGALLGSAIGAAAGAAIDHDKRGRGSAVGVGIGAVGGYIVGNEMDKKKARERDEY